jgi:hypothetical protein
VSALYSAAGVRLKLEFPIAPPRLFLSAAIDMRAPIHPVSYTYAGRAAFEASGLAAGLGLSLLAELPVSLP